MKQSSLLAAFKLQKGATVEPAAKSGKNSSGTPVPESCAPKAANASPLTKVPMEASHSPVTPQASTAQPEVGQCLRVYWPDDDDWYEGHIEKYTDAGKAVGTLKSTVAMNLSIKPHMLIDPGTCAVVYTDGDTEELDLASEQYELVSESKSKPEKSAPEKQKKKGRQVLGKKSAQSCAAVDDGLEDSDVEADSASEGSEFMSEDADASEDVEMDLDASDEDEVSGPDDADSDEDIVVPRKRQAKTSKQAPGASKKAKKNSQEHKQQILSENVDTGNGAMLQTPTLRRASDTVGPGRSTGATPRTGQLFGRLSTSTAAAAAEVTLGDDPGASQRFAQRYKEKKFSFMWPENIRDKKKNRPADVNYDPSTCFIPADWFKANKISDGQQQWWTFKRDNWDSVLLFKMGKFYELFEMDAFVGVECLGLQFMKGEQPHAGFPEAAYFSMAEQLARAGHRVVVVEQTETPDQLKAFNDSAQKGCKRKVVQRQAVAVLTQGTLTDPCMVSDSPHATYVATVVEEVTEGQSDKVTVGVCMVDTAASTLLLGQFEDDKMRSQTLKHFTEVNVSEVLVPKGTGALLQPTTKSMLKGLLPEARFALQPAAAWDCKHGLGALKNENLFSQPLPDHLSNLCSHPDSNSASVSALAGMASYLQRSLLDKAVFSVGTVVPLDTRGQSAASQPVDSEQPDGKKDDASVQQSVALDASALSNLHVLDCEGSAAGSVLAQLDHCVTPAGKRTLRSWLAAPLQCPTAIARRQDAVQDLIDSDAAETARSALRTCGDIERAVVRLAAAAAGALGRDAPGVVLYEDTSRRKVKAVTTLLAGLGGVQTAVEAMQAADCSSEELKTLCSWGQGIPDFRECLKCQSIQELMEATDWEQALKDGRVTPKKGLDRAYDEAVEAKQKCEAELQEYLEAFREQVGLSRTSDKVTYISLNKDSHVLEVAEDISRKVPSSFNACAGKKGVKRFISDDLQDLNTTHNEALASVEAAQNSILSRITATSIGEKRTMWLEVSKASSKLDALLSLAVAAQAGHDSGPMCRPTVTLQHPNGGTDAPFFQAKALRNATQIALSGAGSFVPNDVDLGVSHAPFMLLTGPNTGGKSTLMRQVCTATLLAQVGAWLPAESVMMSPVDAVFVRMGAKDHIMMGQSTFLVELAETATMLRTATRRSLVALDELGRGTATMDGVAVASAVLSHVVSHVGCCGIFATHYHVLADAWAHSQKQVSVKHMACEVENKPDDPVPKVVNKYLLADGACPKSYGPTVARAAGVPVSVTKRAAEISELFEQGNLPVQQQVLACVLPEGFTHVWSACNNSSPPDVTSLHQLQGRVAELNSASLE